MNAQAGELILIMAVAALVLLTVYFVFCRRYDDGLVGLLGLAGIFGGGGLILWDALRSQLEIPPAAYCLLIVGCAVFLVRHGYRFTMFHWAHRFGWSRPRDADEDETIPFPFKGVR